MLSPGTMVGPYRVAEHVGAEGTMAEVYRAVAASGRTVAVKLLGAPREQARTEARAVAGLHHPGIAGTYEVLEQDGRLCLIQEWVDGPSLATVLDQVGRLDLAETVRLGLAVASALDYAHRRGILHRDLKPSNVLCTAGGDYKLVDFGAVGLLEPDSGLTRAGQFAGTPLYMSPEQVTAAPQSPASDIFGLGLLLYRSYYGTVPGESSGDLAQLLMSRTNVIPVPPSPLQGLLERCLTIERMGRPQSAAEVLEALSRIFPIGQPPTPVFPQQGVPGGRADRISGPVVLFRVSALPMVVAAVVAVVAAVLLAWLLAPDPADLGFWLRIAVGLGVVGTALLVARWVRRLASRAPDTERHAAGIITGAEARDALTRSMVVEVDQVVAKLRRLDAKFLRDTMVMLIREAEEATESADRVAALVQLVALMEKLMKQLSPWYVRHKEAIATGIAIVGSLVGVASVVSGFLR